MALMKAGSCSLGACGIRGSVELKGPATVIKSCIFARPRLFTGLIQLCHTSHLRASSWQSTSVLSLGVWLLKPEPQHPALSCCGGHANNFLAGKCWPALISVPNSLCFVFHELVCVLSVLSSEHRGSEVLPLPLTPPMKGFLNVRNFFSFTAPSPRCRTRPIFFVSIFLLPFSCYFMWSLACLFGSLRSSTRLQQVFYRCSRCRYIVNVFVGRKMISMSSVQLLSRVRLFATPWTAACQASLFITNSRSLPKPMSIESVMPSNHLILCRPLLLLPSIFPCIRVFSNESALHIRWPKHWSFSFRISPSNEHQDWSPLGWTGWTSLQSKGLSRVFSNTTVQKHQFFGAQLSF